MASDQIRVRRIGGDRWAVTLPSRHIVGDSEMGEPHPTAVAKTRRLSIEAQEALAALLRHEEM